MKSGDPGIYRKLVWLTFFRVTMVTVLLGGAAAVTWRSGAEAARAVAPLYALIVITYAASLAVSVLLRARRAVVALAYAHIALDVAVAAAIVGLTGGTDSLFVFLFSLGIVNGAILLFRRGAIVAAALAIVADALLASTAAGGSGVPALALFAHGSAFVATAALASYLAEQLRWTGERLAARESDLAAITALHESIVQSMTSGLVTLDGAGRVSFLNRAGEAMTGLSLAGVHGRPAAGLFPGFLPGSGRDEIDFVTPRGERLRLGYSIFPLVGRGGTEIGSAVIFQDLTRFRAMEDAVQRSARLADLGRVAAGLAHELRNPLAAMSGSLEMLRAQPGATEDDRRLMGIVLREASRLDELVTEFLRFARPAPPRRMPTDLAALLDETLRVFANAPAAAGLHVERALAPAGADCDPDQVRQVVWNLLLNAAHAVASARRPGGGRIRVSCGRTGEGAARVVVDDDGPGVAVADREKIFLPFFTTKERGTGLGLATVHRIVDAHGGTVAVESAEGGGARFVLTLPEDASARTAAAG